MVEDRRTGTRPCNSSKKRCARRRTPARRGLQRHGIAPCGRRSTWPCSWRPRGPMAATCSRASTATSPSTSTGRCSSNCGRSIRRCPAGSPRGRATASSPARARPRWPRRSPPPGCRAWSCGRRRSPTGSPSWAATTATSAGSWPTTSSTTGLRTSPSSTSTRSSISRSGATTSARIWPPAATPAASIMPPTAASGRPTGSDIRPTWPGGWRRCPSPWAFSPAPISSPSGCSTPAAARAWPCPRRWPWWGPRTTRRSAPWPGRSFRAWPSTASGWATRLPRCSTA